MGDGSLGRAWELGAPGAAGVSHRLNGTSADVNSGDQNRSAENQRIEIRASIDDRVWMIDETVDFYSHSMVPGGFEVTS